MVGLKGHDEGIAVLVLQRQLKHKILVIDLPLVAVDGDTDVDLVDAVPEVQ